MKSESTRWMFKKFRADGWPICPRCDEDELYSGPCMSTGSVGAHLIDSFKDGFACYKCNWTSDKLTTLRALIYENSRTRIKIVQCPNL